MATKARHLKTPLQLWIADERKARGETPTDLARLTGVTEDTARGWESRGAPSADALAVLERHFGKPAPSSREPGQSGDMAGLVVAMTRALEAQTRALTLLASQVSAARSTAEQERAALTDMLADLGDELEALRAAVGSGAEVAGHGPARN